ncbi:MAG: S-layer family protein [Symploca sp. SIO2C1]|nr:S-layer family protein [Symploca sp. SIO2C1]
MSINWECFCWKLAIALGSTGVVALARNPVLAQSNIMPDTTLGAGENSQVTPDFLGLPIEVITGGAQREQNLFHSFTEFNVAAGRGAYFESPDAAIQNILARVTGVNPSEIFGTLGTFGDSQPNLFLINPNGIIFGQGSALDVGGSFVATTANAVGLGDTGRFSASEPDTSNLLNINPDAFFFNRLSNQAEIVNRFAALEVEGGKSLLLLGGDVRVEGKLQAPGGRVELGGLSEPGTVELNTDGNNLSLNFPDNVARADALLNGAVIENQAGGGGSIVINAQTVDILGGSILFTGIAPGNGSVDSQAGDIEINATDTVTVSESSFIFSAVSLEAVGNGGEIEITTGSLEVTNGAQLSASNLGEGNAGRVKITARDRVRFDGVGSNSFSSGAFSSVQSGAIGNGGEIEITTGSLEVTNGAFLSASNLGEGNARGLRITARDRVRFDGVGSNGFSSGAFSSVQSGAIGNGGEIEITTSSLEVTNGALLNTSTLGEGNAGRVKITARDAVHFDGVGSDGISSGAFSSVQSGAIGNGGEIEITTGSLEVTNGALLNTSTLGEGNAGRVKITARDAVHFDGVGSDGISSGVSSQVNSGAVGNGGEIEITTGSLEVTNGAFLSASTFGKGNAGSLRITASDIVRFDGVSSNSFSSGATSQVNSGAVGNGGGIEITTGSLEVTNGAFLSASTLGKGNAGSLRITASDIVRFNGVGSNGISSSAFSAVRSGAVGDGGVIQISAGSLLLNDAFISSVSEGNGAAGDITIDTRQNLETNRSSIQTTTLSGDGGNITLWVGDLLLMRDNSKISTTAGEAGAGGDGGDISINADFVIGVPRENSDITANAFNGKGGNITITTQGIFGLQFRDRLTPLSDITASSEFGFDGEFILNLLFPIDVTQGLVDLPSNLVDATKLIDRRCTSGDPFRQSSFYLTGRGGIPQNPTEMLDADATVSNWVTFDSLEERGNEVETNTNPTSTTPQRIIEAQGIVRTPDGQLYLAAEVPTVTPHGEWIPAVDCNNFRN